MEQMPEFIGKYKILSVVAVGGMGTVYKALHPSLKRQVIIKKLTLKSGGGAIRERFKREAQILLDLQSPYVVHMFDFFTEGRSDYIVLEFVDGMSLDKLLQKQHSLPTQLALLIFLDACYGLRSAHAKGIVHRDIKPGNILISRRAEVKLADFGIASGEKEGVSAEPGLSGAKKNVPAQEGITQVGVTLGTPAYMSPEQLTDSRSVDQRADIYSMGVMLYEMITGTKPYSGDMSAASIAKIKKGDYIPPEKLDKNIPKPVCSLIKKMLKVKPGKRYQTIDPVIAKVKSCLKKYDQHKIRISLAQCVISPNAVEIPAFEAKKNIPMRIAAVFAASALFLCGMYFAWTGGFFHRTILSPWYTRVEVNLTVPATASVDADLPARIFFFKNDNDELPEVSGTRRIFIPGYEVNSFKRLSAWWAGITSGKGKPAVPAKSGNMICSIKPVFLSAGNYRVKIVEGPYIWWESFSLGKTDRKKVLDLNFLKNERRTLQIKPQALDAVTGAKISDAKFLVNINNRWQYLDDVDQSSFNTGRVYKIRAVAEGYDEEYFSLLIDWYQDVLFVNARLTPKK